MRLGVSLLEQTVEMLDCRMITDEIKDELNAQEFETENMVSISSHHA